MSTRTLGRAILGLDIGTSSAKAAAYDPDGVLLEAAEREYPLLSPRPGRAELDPEAVLAAVHDVLAEVTAGARRRGVRVAGVALGSAMHTLLALDASTRPLTPVVTYADNRAAAEARALRSDGGLAVYRRTGTPVQAMSPLVKLQWFRAHEPQIWRAASRWVSIKEYVLLRLLGSRALDHSVASATGLLNLERLAWDEEALALAGVRAEQLGELVPTTAVVEGLSPEAAARTGLRPDTPFVVGANDGALANLGVAALRPGVVACSVGTSGALRAVVPRPTLDPEGRLFCCALTEDLWVIGGAVNNGGIVLRWMRDLLLGDVAGDAGTHGSDAYEELTALAAEAPAGAGGLLLLPYLTGERAAYWDALPRGVLFGLQRHHGRAHVVRAALEGVAHQLKTVLGVLEAAQGNVSEVRATGGFTASPLWLQIMADVLGRPVSVPVRAEGSAFGAALLGMHALGWLGSLDEVDAFVRIDEEHLPEPTAVAVHARLQPISDGLAEALVPAFAALEALEALDDDLSPNASPPRGGQRLAPAPEPGAADGGDGSPDGAGGVAR